MPQTHFFDEYIVGDRKKREFFNKHTQDFWIRSKSSIEKTFTINFEETFQSFN